ncbi:MAG: aminoglycoside phosphotransferase family protein [Dehalococcoidia bacterium]|nr:aminoglycoside phosphotransferase family protein [Dehalococcoidia bacterium]
MQHYTDEPLSADLVRVMREAAPDADIARAVVVGRGFDAVAWRVPAPDGDWLVRVPRHPEAHAVIESQQRFAAILERAGLPVPRESALLRGADGEVLGGQYRYVEGELAHVSGRAARQHLAASIARFLTALHALDPTSAASCSPRLNEPSRDVFGPMITLHAPLLAPATRAWLLEVGRRLERASSALPPLVLVHADLKPEHLLLDAHGEIAAVLDFDGVQVTDPALDFSRLIQHWDQAFASDVLQQYGGPADAELMVRAQCYRDLDALQVFDTAMNRGLPEWLGWARRHLGVRAAAATRRAAATTA